MLRKIPGIGLSLFAVLIMLTACGGKHFDIESTETESTSPFIESAVNTTKGEETAIHEESSETAGTTSVIPESSSAGMTEKETKILLYGKDTSEYGQVTGWWADEEADCEDIIQILCSLPEPGSGEDVTAGSMPIRFDRAFFQRLGIDKIVVSTEDGNGFFTGTTGSNRRFFNFYYLKYGINYYYYSQSVEITELICEDNAFDRYWDIPEDPDHPCYIDIVYMREDKAVGYSVLRGVSDHTVIRFDVFHEALFTEANLSREQALPALLAWHEGNMGPGEPMRQPELPAPEQTTAWADNPYASAEPQAERTVSVLETDEAGVYGIMFGKWIVGNDECPSLPIEILPAYFEGMESDSIEVTVSEEDAVLCPLAIKLYSNSDFLLTFYTQYGISDGLYKSMTITSPKTIYWDIAHVGDYVTPDHPYYIDILYCRDGKVTGYSVLEAEISNLLLVTVRVLHEASFPDGPVTREEAMVNIMRQHEK